MAVKYGMLIDLGKCIGCGTCAIACKTENNTRHEDLVNGRKYNWADFHAIAKGTFPNTEFHVTPVLCNHCGERTINDPPCVNACPVVPDGNGNKAIWKTTAGITMRDDLRCQAGIIAGCGLACMGSCPYSSLDVISDGVQWSVNHYNPAGTSSHPYWEDTTEVIAGGTSSPAAVAAAAGTAPPCKNDYTHPYYNAVRPANTVEKCYFCEHRLLNSEEPYCVVSCPAGARIFGDQNNPSSQIAQLLAANTALTLKNNLTTNNDLNWQAQGLGTSPNVFYIGPQSQVPVSTEEASVTPIIGQLNIYPNPATDNTTVEFELNNSSEISISLYDMSGKEVVETSKENLAAGVHKTKIDVSGLSNGTYICSLKTKEGVIMTENIIIAR
ncbi:MAG: T9SS type A sorting domain-containing protein [Bacteroidetes bacterium]|nr:T9SS type A sorting domain-containing protein [Bacteroidota bacterium]